MEIEIGFGSSKETARILLKTVIDILDQNSITHFLISGTLLGYVRHKDFIPWDDDIDLLVSCEIYKKLDKISIEHENLNIFQKKLSKYDAVKICFSEGLEIEEEVATEWENYNIRPNGKYTWPFIDLFVYESGPGIHNCGTFETHEYKGNSYKIFNPYNGVCSQPFRFFSSSEISFFHNDWKKEEFFPEQKVNFLGINCNIPKNPDYFLKENYGQDYLTVIKPPETIHKKIKS